jgi:hypothetical protein
MKPGTMYILIRFPAQWPPSTPQVLLDNEDRGTRARLSVANLGRPRLELSADGDVEGHIFQTIQPTGIGYCAIAVTWGDGTPPSLFMNGKEVRSLKAAGDEVLEIPLKPEPLPTSQGITVTGEALGRMTAEERLFLESLHDLERRITGGTSYDLLMASGVVRKLLFDENPIAHQANRHHRVPLAFQVLRRSDPLPSDVPDPELHFDGLYPDGAAAIEVTEEQLWRHRVLYHGSTQFTTLDVLDAAAHVLGGVHLRKPKTDAERRIVELAQRIAAMNTPLPLYAVRDIAMIVASGLLPLARAVADKYQAR